MIVRVESCWGGGDRHHWRLEFRHNRKHYRERIAQSGPWDRQAAGEALDLLELYGIHRRNVKFSVK